MIESLVKKEKKRQSISATTSKGHFRNECYKKQKNPQTHSSKEEAFVCKALTMKLYSDS